MTEAPRRWLIAYDIGEDARRDRLARHLLSYGDRVQYSVFLVDARPAKLIRLRASIADIIEPEDSVLIVEVGPVDLAHRRCTFLGRHRAVTGTGHLIV